MELYKELYHYSPPSGDDQADAQTDLDARRSVISIYLQQQNRDVSQRLRETLCNACQRISISTLRREGGYGHSDNYLVLVASAERCPMCRLMVAALRKVMTEVDVYLFALSPWYPVGRFKIAMRADNGEKVPETCALFAGRFLMRGPIPASAIELEVVNAFPPKRHSLPWFAPLGKLLHATLQTVRGFEHMLTAAGSEASKQGVPEGRRVSGDEKFRIMEEWLRSERLYQSQDEGHLELPDDLLGPILPTRVIDVTLNPASPNDEGIDIKDLPKTFQDTVIIARRLGVRYIWIDALCIYSSRTAMKHLGTMRFAPQFWRGLMLHVWLVRSGSIFFHVFNLKSISTPCQSSTRYSYVSLL